MTLNLKTVFLLVLTALFLLGCSGSTQLPPPPTFSFPKDDDLITATPTEANEELSTATSLVDNSSPTSTPFPSPIPETTKCDDPTMQLISSANICLDQFEVTNEAYQQCLDAGGCTSLTETKAMFLEGEHKGIIDYFGVEQFRAYPVIQVTWQQAEAYCMWAGKRLPTSQEWDQAYSTLNPTPQYSKKYPEPVGSLTTDQTPDGIYDLHGNVREWMADEDGSNKWVRGQSFSSHNTTPPSQPPTQTDWDVGFRCAKDISSID